jgi:hypothetical protein
MKEEIKRKIFKKAYGEIDITGEYFIDLETLIRCMWAINRESVNEDNYCICSSTGGDYIVYFGKYQRAYFSKKDHNNSEQTALEKALEYIFEQKSI